MFTWTKKQAKSQPQRIRTKKVYNTDQNFPIRKDLDERGDKKLGTKRNKATFQ